MIDQFPYEFSGVETWWVSGLEDWQFIYDHLDDYNKFKIRAFKLAGDETCKGESIGEFCNSTNLFAGPTSKLYDNYFDGVTATPPDVDYFLNEFENAFPVSYQGVSY